MAEAGPLGIMVYLPEGALDILYQMVVDGVLGETNEEVAQYLLIEALCRHKYVRTEGTNA